MNIAQGEAESPPAMTKKQPTQAPATDEWGIYDPSKAGMQALYSRLGRPVLRASAKSTRRREAKIDHPADGVGLAIAEARRRADILSAPVAPPPPVSVAEPAPVVVPAPVAAIAPVPQAPATDAPAAKATRAVRAKTAKTSKRKLGAAVSAAGARLDEASARRATTAARPAVAPAPPPSPAPAPAPAAAAPPARRATRKTTRHKPAAPAAVTVTPAVPSPSPRRPRGPVPLAAWAHAVSETSGAEPKRSEGKGLWRGIFRIPSEVALVEYARGCRIHRLVIEASNAPLDEPL
jgi:hypothetical protein